VKDRLLVAANTPAPVPNPNLVSTPSASPKGSHRQSLVLGKADLDNYVVFAKDDLLEFLDSFDANQPHLDSPIGNPGHYVQVVPNASQTSISDPSKSLAASTPLNQYHNASSMATYEDEGNYITTPASQPISSHLLSASAPSSSPKHSSAPPSYMNMTDRSRMSFEDGVDDDEETSFDDSDDEQKVVKKKLIPPIATMSLNDQNQKSRHYGEVPIARDWFMGNISRVDAEKILLGCGVDCFLVRNSSVERCYALSKYFVASKSFIHFIISPTQSGGYHLKECAEDSASYASLEQLINNSPITRGFISAGGRK